LAFNTLIYMVYLSYAVPGACACRPVNRPGSTCGVTVSVASAADRQQRVKRELPAAHVTQITQRAINGASREAMDTEGTRVRDGHMTDDDPYQEMLDDPSLPFDLRWALVSEIDRTNHDFGVYRKLLADWDTWMGAQTICRHDRLSVLDVGSGSGGLTREILRWGRRRGMTLDMHLYESQGDVLRASVRQFADDAKPTPHLATDRHLEVFPDKAFDYVVSLHVIHHIRPFERAAHAMAQMLRIARRGVFVVDFEPKPWAVPFARMWNRLFGVSPDLSKDGIRSLRRAYPLGELVPALCRAEPAGDYHLDAKCYSFVPYWRLRATRTRGCAP
jgi:SAM-dependent methyltransferase